MWRFLFLSFSFICVLPISQINCGFATVTLARDGQKDAQSIQILLLFSSLAHLFAFLMLLLLAPFFFSGLFFINFCSLTPPTPLPFIFSSVSPMSPYSLHCFFPSWFSSSPHVSLSFVFAHHLLLAVPGSFPLFFHYCFFWFILSLPSDPQEATSTLSSPGTLRLI